MAKGRPVRTPQYSGASERTLVAISIIGSACEALRASPAVGPITISLPADAIGVQALRKLAFCIAERYNLLVDIGAHGAMDVVRLRRSEASR